MLDYEYLVDSITIVVEQSSRSSKSASLRLDPKGDFLLRIDFTTLSEFAFAVAPSAPMASVCSSS